MVSAVLLVSSRDRDRVSGSKGIWPTTKALRDHRQVRQER
jgi:hypothetical protein